jgi:probable HAF family extracellular repeat protein
MSDKWNRVSMAQEDLAEPGWAPATDAYNLPRSRAGRFGICVRLMTLLSATVALGILACTSEETPTEPSSTPSPAAALRNAYTAVDLGSLTGDFGNSLASDINPAGQIVGLSQTGVNLPELHAVLWTKGGMTDLGTLGGNFSQALGINPAGEVVGWSFILPGSPANAKHAFLWKNGVMTDLGTLGGRESVAWGINPAGQVVGSSQIAEGVSAPNVFLWEKGVMTDLGFEPYTSEHPVGINTAGRVVGGGKLWTNGVVTELGSLGGCCTSAHAINSAGQVVGLSYLPGNEVYHAFLWDKGVMRDLGTLGETSEATDINSKGQIVGTSGNRAFLWENGVMTELISLDRRFASYAAAINPAGEIVGTSITERGTRATLWRRK